MDPRFRTGIVGIASAGLAAVATSQYYENSASRAGGGEREGFVPITLAGSVEAGRGSPVPPTTSLSDPRLSLRQLARIGEEAARTDPVSAVLAAADIPGHDNREAYFAAALGAWAEREGAVAADWVLEHFEGSLLSDALYFVADGWAESDPESAGEWFLAHTAGVVRRDSLWEVLEAWGRKDPASAAAWSDGLDDGLKWQVIDGLAEGWAAVDPAAAAEYAERIGETEYAGDFLTSVAKQWAASDPEGAAAWSATLKAEAAAATATFEIGAAWAARKPTEAARWAGTQQDPGRRRWAEEGVVLGWSDHAPGQALAWMLDESGSRGPRADLVAEVVETWSEIDPNAVSAWISAREPGPATDLVLQGFSAAVLEADPEAAMAWAGEISDPSLRQAHWRELGSAWLALEGLSAISAIEGLGLPIDMKALLGE